MKLESGRPLARSRFELARFGKLDCSPDAARDGGGGPIQQLEAVCNDIIEPLPPEVDARDDVDQTDRHAQP